jgi:RNA polymerase sigma-32 factor
VTKFDPDQGIRLISYAVWWIRAYIQGYVLQSWSLVKVGTTQAQRRLFFSLARTRRELGADLAGDDLDERVARRLRVRPDEVREAATRMDGRDVSIDAPGASGSTPLERMESADEPADEQLSQARETHKVRAGVARALSLLDERERVIVEERLMADDPVSLQDLGTRFGFSRERARQIEIRARGKLRLALGALAAEVECHPGLRPEAAPELLAG